MKERERERDRGGGKRETALRSSSPTRSKSTVESGGGAAAFAKREREGGEERREGEGRGKGREGGRRRLIICCTRTALPSLDYVRLTAPHKSMSERASDLRLSPVRVRSSVRFASSAPPELESELVR